MSSEGALKLFTENGPINNFSLVNKYKIALFYPNTVGLSGDFNILHLSPLTSVARRRTYSDLIYTTKTVS